MKTTITVTSKGQTTIPAEIRQRLGIEKQGGKLKITWDEKKGAVVLTKPISMTDLSKRVDRHRKSDTSPVTNVDAYYQEHRAES